MTRDIPRRSGVGWTLRRILLHVCLGGAVVVVASTIYAALVYLGA